jgi:uncharacterized protein YjlB
MQFPAKSSDPPVDRQTGVSMKREPKPALTADAEHYEAMKLRPRDWVPNNPRLAVLLYRRVLDPAAGELGAAFEALFTRNAWPPQWRDGIFDYHHFHSTAHEVLGVLSGEAQVIVGGPGGRVVTLEAGDVLLLPAGTGHCLQSSAGRFQVVGAYPAGQQWDIRRAALSESEMETMERLPFPLSDPVAGAEGPLLAHWR